MIRAMLAALVVCSLPLFADDALLTHEYDLRALSAAIKTRQPAWPALGMRSGDSSGWSIFDDQDFDADEVGKTIRDLIAPDSWEDGRTVREIDGRLRIRTDAKTHGRIRALIAQLSRIALTPIHLELTEYEGSSAQLTALLTGALELKGWKRLGSQQLETRGGQAVARRATRSEHYLGFVRHSAESRIFELGRGDYRLGELIKLTPVLSADGSRLLIHTRLDRARLAGPHATFDTGLGVMELPHVLLRRQMGSSVIAANAAGLIAAYAMGKRRRVLVVRHRSGTPPRLDAGTPSGTLRVIDLRQLAQVRAYESPLRRRTSVHFGGSATRLSTDRAIDQMQEKIAPDSWGEAGNDYSMLAGLLVLSNVKEEAVAGAARWFAAAQSRQTLQVTTRVRFFSAKDKTAARKFFNARSNKPLSRKQLDAIDAMLANETSGLRCVADLVQHGLIGDVVGSAAIGERYTVDDVYTDDETKVRTPTADTVLDGTSAAVQALRVAERPELLRLNIALERRIFHGFKRKTVGKIAIQRATLRRHDSVRSTLMTPGKARLTYYPGGFLLIEAWITR